MTPVGTTALLLVDVQRDFLDRPGLVPPADVVVAACAALLAGFRAAGLPVVHVRTGVRPDGTDAMPHWLRAARLPCVDGTPGAAPPPVLLAAPGELVVRKRAFRAFADERLDGWLRDHGATRVVVAGLYAHACVREAAVDAYELGYRVVVASDAVGSDDPDHARATSRWLAGRAAELLGVDEVVRGLSRPAGPTPAERVEPVVAAAAAAAPAWAALPVADRAAVLHRWAEVLSAHAEDLAGAIVAEVGKPVADARTEVARAVGHVRSAVLLASAATDEAVGPGVVARRRPVGVVGLLMPWNNPLALPVGKIAPALALGDAVVLKPAPQGAGVTDRLLASLADAGVPVGLVGRVDGGADVGAALVRAPGVDAIAVTGSIATGRSVARECTRLGRPLQAELGGNNAAIVLADADLVADVPALVRNAFSYAGQRCTAVRRFVVDRTVLPAFVEAAAAATTALRVGDPRAESTEVGPLIDAAARDRVNGVIQRAVAAGARVLAVGDLPAAVAGAGPFVAPTLLLVEDPTAQIAQEETFGPVAVVIPADGEDDAVARANGVAHGLLLAVCTQDPAAAARVLDAALAGIVQWGPGAVPVHPDAPFGGWKASGHGPPEHGRWDADFLTRPQARYGPA